MASRWGNRRRQVIMIMLAAIIPFTFIVTWLLAGAQPALLNSHHSPPSSDSMEHHFEQEHQDHVHAGDAELGGGPGSSSSSRPASRIAPATSTDKQTKSPSVAPSSSSSTASLTSTEEQVSVPSEGPVEEHSPISGSASSQSTKARPSPTAFAGPDSTIVAAKTGRFRGKVDDNYDNVREFLDVPYALPPVGDLRWEPPVDLGDSDDEYDATELAMACPQLIPQSPSIWSEQLPWYRIPAGKDEAGRMAKLTSEDCLKLAIWTPANATSDSYLPVAMFWPGGGFQSNGILVPAHQPAQWVSRSQSHVVVTINYRLGVLGFPGSGALEDQNLGLLDQRMALEWVFDNIRSFGGDPERILVWGFSAGAQSVDFHNYAYWEDPIAHAYFAQSGSVMAFGSGGKANDYSKFTFLANKFRCEYPGDYEKELDCMRKIDHKELIDFLGAYHGNERLRFGPVVDDKTVFSDYVKRYSSNKVSNVPMIYSSAANDGASLAGYNANSPDKLPQSQDSINGITKRIMCGAVESAKLRQGIGMKTHRYQYAGVWKNQNPLEWLGSYHSSDLPMFFGTYDNGTGDESEALEAKTSEAMQDALLAFMEDPESPGDWPLFEPLADDGGAILRFGAGDSAIEAVPAHDIDGICSGAGEYNPFP